MCTPIQSFDPVASHLELVILSGKFRITEHAQSSVVEYFSFFFAHINSRAAFSPGYGYNASSNATWTVSIRQPH